MGKGIGSLDTAIESLFSSATNEIQIVAYRISEYAPELFDRLRFALQDGIEVRLVINRLDEHSQKVKDVLSDLQKFKGFRLFKYTPRNDFDDLHAKILVIDRKKAMIGSANLSWRGLVGNHEIGIIVKGKSAGQIATLLDILIQKSPQILEVRRTE